MHKKRRLKLDSVHKRLWQQCSPSVFLKDLLNLRKALKSPSTTIMCCCFVSWAATCPFWTLTSFPFAAGSKHLPRSRGRRHFLWGERWSEWNPEQVRKGSPAVTHTDRWPFKAPCVKWRDRKLSPPPHVFCHWKILNRISLSSTNSGTSIWIQGY